jgi:hypothetical protein
MSALERIDNTILAETGLFPRRDFSSAQRKTT